LRPPVYPRFDLRHCHDIDLLVPPGAMPSAREALIGAGFRAGRSRHVLQHRDGLPVTLHGRLWAGSSEAALLERAGTIEIDGETVPILAPMDMLLHACDHPGVGAGLGNWVWIIDAAMILRRHKPTAEDWAGLVRGTVASGATLPVAARLAGLADRIGLPVPDALLCRLAEAAWRSSRGERDVALMAAHAASGQGLRTMIRRCGWRSRIEIAAWAIRGGRRQGLAP
jgi:hypothetical protein